MTLHERFMSWLKKPYSEDMSVAGWFYFLALVSILAFLWSRVLRLIAATLSEVN